VSDALLFGGLAGRLESAATGGLGPRWHLINVRAATKVPFGF
jgi:hypothetical protein